MLVLSTDDLKKLNLTFKPFRCPRCQEVHEEAAQWLACRIITHLKTH